MRNHCKVHGYMDVMAEEAQTCPYCEITDLKSKLSRYEQAVSVEAYAFHDAIGDFRFKVPLTEEWQGQRVRVIVMKEEQDCAPRYPWHPTEDDCRKEEG